MWIMPNMCNSMHDCNVSEGDAWLETFVPKILNSHVFRDNGRLFITFDEGKSEASCCIYSKGGRIATLVASPVGAVAFGQKGIQLSICSLATIESAWNLPLLGGAACKCSPTMEEFFTVVQ